jgi:tetratricopeptide (TPR) repeat protein
MNRILHSLAIGLALWTLAGCERVPPDAAALRKGVQLELKGDFPGAEAQYLEACSLGSGEAYQKLAGLLVNREGAKLFLDGKTRGASWVTQARALLERIETVSSQAADRDCPVEGIAKTLASYRKTIAETEERLEKERAETEARLAKERAEREEAARIRAEEKKREEAAAAAKRAAEQAEEARRAEEAQRLSSPEYCIEHGLELSSSAFRTVCRAMNYTQNTGNTLVDNEETERQHARFRGQRVKLSGKIAKVDSKIFGGVKIKLDVYGENVWANFPSMTEGEGKRFRVGQTLRVEGKIESAMINPFNLAQCTILSAW